MFKLLLINPSESRKKKSGLGAFKSSSIAPLSLAYVASLTPETYSIRIVDENIEILDFPDADLVGITSFTPQIRRAYEIATHYREKSTPVVMGGIHVSMVPDEALKYCDTIVIGEAEPVWNEVLRDFERGSLRRTYKGEPVSLDRLPVPDRSLFKGGYLWDSILTSKGCPMDCNFCSVTRFNGRKFRRRPTADVINELSTIKSKFCWVLDDNFLGYGDKEWLTEFFNKIIELKIKKYFFIQASMKLGEDKILLRLAYRAGVRVALIGIESTDKESLKQYNKKLNTSYADQGVYLSLIRNIRKAGIAVLGCFILGGDSDKIESFHQTLSFINRAHIDVLQLSKPTPLPGTAFFQQLNDASRIMDTNFPDAWRKYTFTRILYEPKNLKIDDVYEGFHYLRSNYYSTPQRLRRLLFTLMDTKSLSSTLVSILLDKTYRKSWKNSELFKDYGAHYLKHKFFIP
ncbi:MAG: radical SAM protein [Desulfobacteraceae bacterium]|nr:radical SAM protein [Desulfobacteraceae bacterium]